MFKYGKKSTGGGPGGTIPIYDEGVLVNPTPAGINFIGADVLANNKSGGIVNVFIPPPQFVSHFNTLDGTSNAIVVPPTLTNRFVPHSKGDFNVGDWVTPLIRGTLTGATTIYSNGFFSIVNSLSTTFSVRVRDGFGAIIRQHTLTITGDYDSTKNNIRVRLYNFSADSTKYKAQAQITIELGNIFPIAGRFSIEIEHNDNEDGIFSYIQSGVYYDKNIAPISLSGVSVAENLPFVRRISGVAYYTLGSTFIVGISDIDNLNNASYPTDYQVLITGNEYNLPTLSLSGNQLTGWSADYNVQNVSFSKNDWRITTPNFFSLHTTARVWAQGKDWSLTAPVYSSTKGIAINTMVDTATDTVEDFVSESYRLNSLFVPWNSYEPLNTYDDGKGLMVLNTRLVYPTGNYSIYAPEQATQPNYTSLQGERFYLRHFRHANVSHSNGRFVFADYNITEALISSEAIKLEISLDGVDWYSVNKPYLGGALLPGAGCRIFPDQHSLSINNSIQFTLGTGKFTSSSSNWGLYLKITYLDESLSAYYIGRISLPEWA